MAAQNVVELLALAREGDSNAYVALAARFAGPAWIVSYLDEGDPAHADDRLHRAIVGGWRRRDSLAADVDVAAWLRDRALEHRVRRWFAPRSCALWHRPSSAEAGESPRQRLHSLTSAFLWALPGECREPLLLRYRQGMSVCRTARLLGEPIGAVRRRLASALAFVDAGVEDLLRDERGILGPQALSLPQPHAPMAGMGPSLPIGPPR